VIGLQILIADDEKDMLKILKAYFVREGFEVFTAEDGQAALDIFYREKIKLAVLDWMMPKVNGIDVCREIKKTSQTKVLVLTAKSQNEDELKALTNGADEYVKKPFDPRILIIRAKKLLGEENIVQWKDLKINLEAKKVYKNGKNLNTTKKEFELLETLWNNRGIILSRNKLLDRVWGFDYSGGERTVDTHIRRLREKIGEDFIQTYKGLGYSLEDKGE
jgi:two-component system, OmpR family, alkaline phosphatase synthesis response regulator PhoP